MASLTGETGWARGGSEEATQAGAQRAVGTPESVGRGQAAGRGVCWAGFILNDPKVERRSEAGGLSTVDPVAEGGGAGSTVMEVTRASSSPQPSESLRPPARAFVPVLKASVSIFTVLPAARGWAGGPGGAEAAAQHRHLPSPSILFGKQTELFGGKCLINVHAGR